MTTRTTAIVFASVLLLATGARAQDQAKDRAKAEREGPATVTIARNCMACHGVNGLSPGAIPTLYGKTADFLDQRKW